MTRGTARSRRSLSGVHQAKGRPSARKHPVCALVPWRQASGCYSGVRAFEDCEPAWLQRSTRFAHVVTCMNALQINICMHVYAEVRMYVRTYVRMYVDVYVCAFTSVFMSTCMHAWLCGVRHAFCAPSLTQWYLPPPAPQPPQGEGAGSLKP